MAAEQLDLADLGAQEETPRRHPGRGMYVLPSLFTAGNMALGYYAMTQSVQGSVAEPAYFDRAALAIGVAALLDGVDGFIARVTHTTSDFGHELDSLADVITFGVAPSLLAYIWGFRMLPLAVDPDLRQNVLHAGVFVCFLFLVCGASRLARFNIQHNPIPSNPGRPDKKYFVGLPIPAAAGMVASVVYAAESEPLHSWIVSAAWLCLIALLSFLMVSTWRYPSFKDLNLTQPRSPVMFVLLGSLIFLILLFSKPVLLGMCIAYVGSGIAIRIGGILRRRFKRAPKQPEHQAGSVI